MKTILYTGGVRSGKSRLAEHRILELASSKPWYLATATPIDAEMRQRIEAHQKMRADRFCTVEEPLELVERLRELHGAVLVECLSLWLNNLLYHQIPAGDVRKRIDALCQVLPRHATTVMVLNDVSSGILPMDKLGRQFVDLSGYLGQRIAKIADEVHLCHCGLALRLK